ncbi:MAG: hypothetical protein KDE53_28400, partial [Caldilineaceae bacterium]|nr:hypothetical protein [Caldilineaceae bacterium]
NADTNGDEVQDTIECIQAIDVVLAANGQATKSAPQGTGNCADTDGDGVPDFADDDNDNDGVADWMDGQPAGSFGDPTTGVSDDTFAFAVANYSDSNPLRVTLELRPTNPEHLWYTMNVLDWPSGDYEGQIRRVHDTTLGTTGAAANGDMQLVPMVEITLPAAEAMHLPTQPGTTQLASDLVGDNSRLSEWLDMAVLERYQMAVSWAKDSQTLLVYLPATLIRDKHGNAPVNFVATMLYRPNGAGLFASVHRARLAWLVQMDHDSCVVPDESSYAESCLPHGADYDKGAHWQTAQRQLVHRYYDSFTVTAFTAEEDVRANAQLFYEDPTQINAPTTYLPDQLLAFGTLLEGYLRAAETPTTALAAYKAAQPALSSRLAAGEVLQDADAYGLIAQLATQEAPRLLDTQFADHRETLPHPTLLYVTWGESNVVGLSGSSAGDSLRLDMAEATPQHATTIRLGTFAYEPNPAMVGGKENPHWVAADPGGVWLDYLQGQGAAAYAQLPAAAQASFSAADFSQTALGLFWNLARGITLPTDLSGSSDDSAQAGQDLVSNLGGGFDMAGENTIGAWIGVLDDFEEAQRTLRAGITQAGMLDMAGKSVSTVANLQGALRTARWVKTMGITSVTMAGLSATLAIVSVLADNLGLGKGAMAALDATNAGLGLTLAGALTALEVTKVVQTVQAAGSAALDALGEALAFQNTLSEVGLVAALAVTAVILVTTLVTFVGMLMDGNGIAAKAALAQGAATAILVVLLFAISTWFPIGTAIALLIGLIDGVITAVCKIWSWAGGTDGSGQTFADRHASLCAGVVGTVTTAVAGFFYKTLPMVDMGYKDRLKFGQTDTELISVENRYGLSVGNLLQVTQPLTVTVRLPEDHTFFSYSEIQVGGHELSTMAVSDYNRLITETNVFNYELITDQAADNNPQLADKMSAERWRVVPTDRQSAAVQRDGLLYKTVYRDMLYKVAQPSIQLTLTAGINWHPDLFVREYYRYSLAECEVVYCDHEIDDFTKNVAGTQAITIGTHLIYDVFPATLTDFYTL